MDFYVFVRFLFDQCVDDKLDFKYIKKKFVNENRMMSEISKMTFWQKTLTKKSLGMPLYRMIILIF